MVISVEGDEGGGSQLETLKHSALFSAVNELLVELIWKGRYV